MAYQNLNKLFVRVPAAISAERLATIISDSSTAAYKSKIYFLEGKNLIVNNGITYGIDPSTAESIKDLQKLVGGEKLETGAKSVIQRLEALEAIKVDASSGNYLSITSGANGEPVIGAHIVSIDSNTEGLVDAKNAKGYIDAKALEANTLVANSSGINLALSTDSSTKQKTYTISTDLTLDYIESGQGQKAKIVIKDSANNHYGEVEVDNIVKNSFLSTTNYDKATGILTLTFATKDGSTNAVKVDLHEMLDINDMSIEADSANYLKVTLTDSSTAENDGSQAVFGVKLQDVSTASAKATGLVDAWKAKQYIDSKSTDLAVTAEGDSYITAVQDSKNNKKIDVSANIANLNATAGTVGTYDNTTGKQATAPSAGTLSGTSGKLADAADIASKVKTYVDGEVAIEAARADAKVKNSIYVLDSSANATGTNVYVKVTEEHGLLSAVKVTESYATITGDSSTFTVTSGDENKMVKAQDLNTLKTYIDGKNNELTVEAEGDSYVIANVPVDNNKKVKVTTNVQNLNVNSQTGQDSSLGGVANSLVDGEQAATTITSFVNKRIAEEVAKLDGTAQGTDSSYINIEVVEADGKLTTASVTTTYGSIADTYREGIATTLDVSAFVNTYDFWETFS